MAATNYTPIQLYFSTTASAVPLAANLAQGELAINITDGKLYYEDNGGVVQVIATKGAGTIGGSTTQIQYNNAGALAGNAAMTFNSGTSTTTLTTLNLTNALGATYGGTAQSTYTQGDILYSSATNTLAKLGIGANTYILTSTGSIPQWVAPSSIAVLTATNLDGGAAGSVPYQSGVATTTFLAIGAANRVMTSSGTAPQWVTSLTGLTGVSSSSITNTSLTSGRVVVSSTAGLQADDADLTFDGTTLSAGGLSTVGLSTLVKTVKIGDSSFNGVAVFAAATPAKLYMGTGTVTDVTSAISATNAIGAIASLGITPIAATNTSVTYTNAATLYIAGAPSAGTNVTITNPYSLYVAAGAAYFGGGVIGTIGATGATTGAFTTLSATGEFTNSTALTGTTIASNRIATFTSLASGRDANISLGDSVNASVRLGYLSGDFYITTSSIERIRVGVSGGVAVTGTLSATGTLSGGTSGTGYSFSGSAAAGSLTLNSSGNLGIGTSSPTAKLDVRGQTFVDNVTASTSKNLSTWNVNGSNYAQLYDIGTAANVLALGGSAALATVPSTPIMAWDLDNANVGIGTSSPAYKLDVTGPGTANGSTLRLNDSASGANSKHLLLQRSSSTATIGIAGALANDPLWLSRSGDYDVLIDSSGNLGLGVTPSAWESGSKAFQISTAGAGGTSGNSFNLWARADSMRLWTNAYFNGGTYVRQVAASVVPTNMTFDSTGAVVIQSAPSGTAGSTFVTGDITTFFSIKKDNTLALQGGTQSSGIGIAFPATQSASTNANTLDDYEEGTWSATITTTGGSVTIGSQTCTYTKVGRLVVLNGFIELSAISSPTGQFTITNLPFVPTISGGSGGAACFLQNIASTLATALFVELSTTPRIYIAKTTTLNSLSDSADLLTATTLIKFGASYST